MEIFSPPATCLDHPIFILPLHTSLVPYHTTTTYPSTSNIINQRCCPFSETQALQKCPVCEKVATGLLLLPLSFHDIDQALAEAASTNLSNKRGKKRHNATLTRLNPRLKSEADAHNMKDSRTGRWTAEETAYCDQLIGLFGRGVLPLPTPLRLHDFLSNLLKSKPARLSKKMKNARLAAQEYKRERGTALTDEEARHLSQLETAFFASISCTMERSEIRFHMQRVWRELFQRYCAQIQQPLQITQWLTSLQELERRAQEAEAAADQATTKTSSNGGCCGNNTSTCAAPQTALGLLQAPTLFPDSASASVNADVGSESESIHWQSRKRAKTLGPSAQEMTAWFGAVSYVEKVIQLVQNFGMPFEHCDVWVPSYVTPMAAQQRDDATCRLCFAGAATADVQVPPGGNGQAVPLTTQEKFDLISFGVYSQTFSLPVGSGLPGRIYSSGVASWEQGIQSAPQSLFERVGGAQQWGIETVLGFPVASPAVGRVVILLYSRHDRPKDVSMVSHLAETLSRLLPTPRWTLTVEVGESALSTGHEAIATGNDPRIAELLALVSSNFPKDQRSPLVSYLPGLVSLRLLLLKRNRTNDENESLDVALNSYEAYKLEGRSPTEILASTSRTFMVMSRQTVSPSASPSRERSSLDSSSAIDSQVTTCAEQSAYVSPFPPLGARLEQGNPINSHGGYAPNQGFHDTLDQSLGGNILFGGESAWENCQSIPDTPQTSDFRSVLSGPFQTTVPHNIDHQSSLVAQEHVGMNAYAHEYDHDQSTSMLNDLAVSDVSASQLALMLQNESVNLHDFHGGATLDEI